MKLSADPKSPNYFKQSPYGRRVRIYLNDILQERAIEADDEAGTVVILTTKIERGKFQTRTLTGNVKFRPGK